MQEEGGLEWSSRKVGRECAPHVQGGQSTTKSEPQLLFKLCLVPQNTEEGVAVTKGLSQLQFCAIHSSTTI